MGGIPSVSPHDLYARLGTASAPLLLDVRREDAFAAGDRLIIGAVHRAPEDVEWWRQQVLPEQFPRRPRNPDARDGHVRRPLHLVPPAGPSRSSGRRSE